MKWLYRLIVPDHAIPWYVWPFGRSVGRYWVEDRSTRSLWP